MNEGALALQMDDPMEVAAHWCVRLSDGDMSETEWSDFEAWEAAPDNAEYLQRAIMVWQACGDVGDRPEVIPLRTEALSQYHAANQSRWAVGKRRAWYVGGALAASLALVFALSLTMFKGDEQIFETGVGERRIASLADTSKVTLDAATKVDVAIGDSAREINLEHGRAKFDVAHDPLRPFRVNAGDKMIVALGTSFSVELVDGEVRVILYKGQVEVRDRNDLAATPDKKTNTRQILKPGMQLVDKVGSAQLGALTSVEPVQSHAWENGLLSFSGDSLQSAAERMNRYSDKKIRLGDPAVGHIAIDGEFEAGNIDAFVEGISTLYDLKATHRDSEIILSKE